MGRRVEGDAATRHRCQTGPTSRHTCRRLHAGSAPLGQRTRTTYLHIILDTSLGDLWSCILFFVHTALTSSPWLRNGSNTPRPSVLAFIFASQRTKRCDREFHPCVGDSACTPPADTNNSLKFRLHRANRCVSHSSGCHRNPTNPLDSSGLAFETAARRRVYRWYRLTNTQA